MKQYIELIKKTTLLCLAIFALATRLMAISTQPDKVVAKDGSGDYTTVQSAIDAAPTGLKQQYVILIKKGVYKELIDIAKGKDYITLIGEDAQTTILTFDNSARKLDQNGKEYGTSKSASTFIKGDHFKALHLTFENSSGVAAGQALAINITGNWSAFKDCRFLGHQDTFFANNGTVQYLKDCYLSGTVDFIFGGSTAVFDHCKIHSVGNGYLTAASTPQGQPYGYVFLNCTVTADQLLKKESVYLGRPWRPYAKVVFIHTKMDGHIKLEGWHNWGKKENETTAYYAEFGSKGAGFEPGKRVEWSKQLTADEVKHYTIKKILGNWKPF